MTDRITELKNKILDKISDALDNKNISAMDLSQYASILSSLSMGDTLLSSIELLKSKSEEEIKDAEFREID